MERWQNKIAVVTGANSGIGYAIVKDLIAVNIIVVALDLQIDNLSNIVNSNLENRLYALKCDVTSELDVANSFEWIRKTLGGVDILINNAGIFREGNLLTMPLDLVKQTLDVNIRGIVNCTQNAYKSMTERKVNGHVIVINSVAGHKIPNFGNDLPSSNIYPPSKYAVTAMVETYRQEFAKLGSKIKITSISPGLVNTELIIPKFREMEAILQPKDVSSAVLYAIKTPPHVQITELTIQPVGEQF